MELDNSNPSPEAETPDSLKEAAIAGALHGTAFVSDVAATHAMKILGDRFVVTKDATGQPVVCDKVTAKSVTDAVKDWLASDDCAHFLRKVEAEPAPQTYEEYQRQVLGIGNGEPATIGLSGRRPAVTARAPGSPYYTREPGAEPKAPAEAAEPPANWEEYQRQVLGIGDRKPSPFLGLGGRRGA